MEHLIVEVAAEFGLDFVAVVAEPVAVAIGTVSEVAVVVLS